MKKLYLNIVSPEKEIYNGEVESVTLPGTIGTFTKSFRNMHPLCLRFVKVR